MNEKKVPEIRFKGFTDDWEQRKVSEITAFHKQGYYTTEEYGDDKKYYLLRGTDLTENRLALNDTPKINATERDYQAFKIQVGDFLIVRSGTVGTYGIVYDDIPAIFGSYLIDFRFDHSKATNEFFGYFYQSDLFKEQLRQIIQQSANTNINAENIKSTWIKLPSIEEQNKIGTFLGALDNLITLHQRKHKKLLSVKKSMLEKMFPQNGAKVPEIRFEGFTDDWEQRKLSELVARYEDPVSTPHDGYTRLGIRSHAKGTFHEYVKPGHELETAQMHRVAADKLIFNITFAWEHAVAITDKNDEGKLVSHRFPQFTLSESLRPEFLKYVILDEQFHHHLYLASPGGAGRNRVLKIDEALDYPIRFPSIDEQKLIGNFLNSLTDLITLHQRELDKLVNIKKSMLEKMFV